ncbi:MAG TPA: universal stress protein [Burkholderiaceae bacterium]|nr:universal stress protein [Burkholderiaceae bacterium]
MRILLAIDGSELSRHAVDYVIKHRDTLARGAEITCVFIDAPPVLRAVGAFGADPGMPPIPPVDPMELVAPHMKALRDAGFDPPLEVREGDPGVEIAQASSEGNYDLIVMGTHGRRLLTRALLGSVANKVLQSGSVPVLLVR